jgi:cytochrome c-type biogenesis protein CcmE
VFKTSQQKDRFLKLAIYMIGALGVVFILISLLYDQISFFVTPAQLNMQKINTPLRLGGLVQKGSVKRVGDIVTFIVQDEKATIRVVYQGVLPNLFRDTQGVIADGYLKDNATFVADRLLVKHDERYMPKGVTDQLKEQQYWRSAS